MVEDFKSLETTVEGLHKEKCGSMKLEGGDVTWNVDALHWQTKGLNWTLNEEGYISDISAPSFVIDTPEFRASTRGATRRSRAPGRPCRVSPPQTGQQESKHKERTTPRQSTSTVAEHHSNAVGVPSTWIKSGLPGTAHARTFPPLPPSSANRVSEICLRVVHAMTLDGWCGGVTNTSAR